MGVYHHVNKLNQSNSRRCQIWWSLFLTPKLLKFLFLPLIKLTGRTFCAGRRCLFLPFGIEEATAKLGLPGANAVSPIDIVTEPVRAYSEIVVVAGDIFGKMGLELFKFFLA